MRFYITRFVIVGLIISAMTCIFYPTSAVALTQSEYVVAVAAKFGLGKDLKLEEAVAILEAVGIVPVEGWQVDRDVTCELVSEVQVKAIKAAQMGFIRQDPEDVPVLMASLSDELDVCPPPTVTVYPAVAIPPPPIAPVVKGGGGTASPSQ